MIRPTTSHKSTKLVVGADAFVIHVGNQHWQQTENLQY